VTNLSAVILLLLSRFFGYLLWLSPVRSVIPIALPQHSIRPLVQVNPEPALSLSCSWVLASLRGSGGGAGAANLYSVSRPSRRIHRMMVRATSGTQWLRLGPFLYARAAQAEPRSSSLQPVVSGHRRIRWSAAGGIAKIGARGANPAIFVFEAARDPTKEEHASAPKARGIAVRKAHLFPNSCCWPHNEALAKYYDDERGWLTLKMETAKKKPSR
jgi:hypothetical protein